MVKTIPDGYHSITPYLICKGAAKALDFYKKAFGATELMRFDMGGSIGHAEIKIGDSIVMLGDAMKEMGHKSPKTLGGTPVTLMMYVEDVDATFDRAIKAGAQTLRPVENQFWGDRMGGVTDPFGHQWFLATHVEDVSPEEMKRRMESMAPAAK